LYFCRHVNTRYAANPLLRLEHGCCVSLLLLLMICHLLDMPSKVCIVCMQLRWHDAARALKRWWMRMTTFWAHRSRLHALARSRMRIAWDALTQRWFHYIPRPTHVLPPDESDACGFMIDKV
jgi:hypothetical protein